MRQDGTESQGNLAHILSSLYALSCSDDDCEITSQTCHINTPEEMSDAKLESSTGVVDIGKVLLQLTGEIARVNAELDRERCLRVSIEAENKHLSDAVAARSISSISIDETSNLSLERCLKYIASLPPHMQEAVYIGYNEKQAMLVRDIVISEIRAILRPVDVPGLMFVLMTECVVSSDPPEPCDLIPFTIDNLQFLLGDGGMGPADELNGYYVMDESLYNNVPASPSATVMSSEDGPRLNLIEALDVQSDEDIRRIVTVRKCHKLGFKSHVFLKQYFSKFGAVEKVVLLPMRSKPKQGMDFGRNTRPSSMGFVVMKNEDTVSNILSFDNSSGVHIIKGWPIEVRQFVRPADKPGMSFGGASNVVPSSSSTISS